MSAHRSNYVPRAQRPGRSMSEILLENKCLKERNRQLEEALFRLRTREEQPGRALLSIPTVAMAKKQLDDAIAHFERVVTRAHSAG